MSLRSARTKATVRDLRQVNRSAVLRPLFLDGPLNRVALAQITGLSSGSVTNVTAALLEEGLIREAGQEESDGGRPRVLLEVNPEFGATIGVEVGETGIRVEGFDLRMRVAGAADVAIHPQHHPAATAIERIAEAVQKLMDQFRFEGRRLLGVGVAVPGIVETKADGAVVHAHNIGWEGVPLERMLKERLQTAVFVENGAKALGQAEMWLGAGRGTRHAIVALWGTGVGAAIFTNGAIYKGAASSAGEWGHTCIVVTGKLCRCGATGCLEAYIGAAPLLAAWQEADPDAYRPEDPDAEDWADRLLEAASVNPRAAQVLEQAARYFGVAAANLVNLFDPEKLVIGGWLGLKLAPSILPRIHEAMAAQVLAYPGRKLEVEVGHLGPQAVALGASTLVVDELLRSGGVPPASSQN
jgi:predicted NBD/HSP70 family sugar kinase